jgi:hypothetical protein
MVCSSIVGLYWRRAVDENYREKEVSSLQAVICPGRSKSEPAEVLLKNRMPEGKQSRQPEKMAA